MRVRLMASSPLPFWERGQSAFPTEDRQTNARVSADDWQR